MRRYFIILLCAFMALSHGGVVTAHSHDAEAAVHGDAGHVAAHAANHDDAHDRAAPDADFDDDPLSPHQAPIGHSHAAADAVAKAPMLAGVHVVKLRFEPPLRRDAVPPSATVAPGLEPPDA